MTDVDVLIVGAGPTGLALATELTRFGLSYRLVDRAPHAAQWSQALVVHARTLEQFERYGIADTAVARGRKVRRASIFSEQRAILQIDLDQIHSRYTFILFLPQNETEQLLGEHLRDIGGSIERGVELAALENQPAQVVATLRHADGSDERVAARWLVGCDGARSTVRHITGVPFEGTTVDHEFLLGDVQVSGDGAPGDELRLYLHHGALVFVGRINDSLCRVIVASAEPAAPPAHDDDHTLTLDRLQAAVDLCVGPGMRLSNPTWMTRFRINQRKVHSYRAGQVFLAGDAAHIHAPVAGQGMNTGIQDAANLAWKLAAVAHGAPDGLLDTYNQERGVIGEAVVSATGFGLSAAMTANPALERVRDYVLGWLGGLSFVQARARGIISETALHYRGSQIAVDCGGNATLRSGDRAPDVTFHDAHGRERRLAEWFTAPAHLLLALDVTEAQAQALADTCPGMPLLRVASTDSDELARSYGNNGRPMIYAMRPDGYIGFRGDPDDMAVLRRYVRTVGATHGIANE